MSDENGLVPVAPTVVPATPPMAPPDPFQELMKQKDVQTGRQLPGGEESTADWLIRKQTERDAPFKAAVQQGFDVPQNQAIRLLRTASALGVPADLIEGHLDEAEKEANRDAFDSSEFQKYSPALAKWLSQDPNYVAVMKPDFSGMVNLQRIFYRKNDPNRPQTEEEMATRAMQLAIVQGERVSRSTEVGGVETELGTTPTETTPSMTPAQKSEAIQGFYARNLAELKAENELLKRYEPIGAEEALGSRLSENPYAPVPVFSELMDYALKYGPIREASKRVESGTHGIEDIDLLERAARLEAIAQKRGTTLFGDVSSTVMQLAPFAIAAAATGGISAGVEGAVSRAAGAAGESFLQRFAAFSLSKAAGAAVVTPLVGLGRIPLGAIKRNTPGGDYGRDEQGNAFYNIHAGSGEDFSVGVTKEAFSTFADLLSAHAFGWWTKTQGAAATKDGLLAHILKTGGKDALQGMAMGDLAQFMKEAAGVQPWDMPSSLKMLYDPKARQEGLATGIVFASLGIAGAGPEQGISNKLRAELVSAHAEAIRTYDALKAHDQALTDAGVTIKGMSSFKAAPEINRQALDAVVQDEPFQSVNAHQFEEVYSQQGKDAHAEAATLTGKPEALQEALDLGPGGEMKVPTAAWLSRVSATDQAALFQGAARRDPMSPTSMEAQKHIEELDQQMEAERSAKPEIEAAKKAQAKVDQEASTIGEKMAAQVEAAGRTKPEASTIGKIIENVYRIFGMRGKETPEALVEKYGPIIQKGREANAGGQQLEQPGAKDPGPRGTYIPREITNDKGIINALENGDPSSIPHELGHHFLDMMADLASKPETADFESGHNQSIRQDFQTFLDWRDIQSLEEWQKMTLDEKRSHHEAWADAYEQWLFEGKAPSKGLRAAFYRFREWIGAVYDKFVGKSVVIPEQIRGVFERMHATDAEINAAKERLGRFEPFLEDAPNVVFTPAEQEKMAALQAEANVKATERVDAEALSDIKQEQSEQYRHAKDIIRREVTAEVDQRKDLKALALLQRGTLPDGSPLPENLSAFKLDRKSLEAKYGKELVRTLPRGIFAPEGGFEADLAADILGFNSGDELVQSFQKLQEARFQKEPAIRAKISALDENRRLLEQARSQLKPENDATRKQLEEGKILLVKRLEESLRAEEKAKVKELTDTLDEIRARGGIRPTERTEALPERLRGKKGEGIPSDELAQEFYDRGIIKDAYSDDLYDYLQKTVAAVNEAKERSKDAKAEAERLATEKFGQSIEDLISNVRQSEGLTQLLAETRKERSALDRQSPDSREAIIGAETEAQAARHLVDPTLTLTEEARQAIHNDAEQKLNVYQMEWLARNKFPTMVGLIRKFTDPVKYIKELQDYAVRKMDVLTYVERDPHVYERAEKDARKAARDAILKGDFRSAIAFKEKEALSHELARAAYEATTEADKADRYMKKFTGKPIREMLGKAGNDYLDVIDGMMERFEFSNITEAKRQSRVMLQDFILDKMKSGEDLGEHVTAPDWLRNEAFRMNWKDLKHGDLMELKDNASRIEKMARQANQLIQQDRQMTMDQARADIKERLSVLESRPPESSRTAKGVIEKLVGMARSADAAMVKMEQVIREADRGDINGPFHRLFMFGAADAQARELDLRKSVQAELAEAINSLPKEQQARMGDLIALPGRRKITRFDTLGFAHQAGNASNWSKFLRGEAMRKGGFTEAEVSKFLHDLTKEEKDLIQVLWDLPEPVFDQASKMYKRLTGLEPDKITAQPQHPAFEGYRGGYAHIVYDARESRQGEMQANAMIGDLAKPGYSTATSANGYSKGRSEGFAAPMDTDLNNFPAHMGMMIKDLTHREWMLDVNKLLGDKEISENIKDKLGPETLTRMKEWLKVIVNDRNQNSLASLSVFRRLINSARLNMAILATGFKAGTLLHHATSIEGAIGELGPKYMAMGAQRYFTAPFGMHKFIAEKSGEMRHYAETFDRDILEIYNKTSGKKDYVSMSQRGASHAIGIANLMRADPIWLGGYFKALDTLPETHTGQAREDLAIRSADEVVRLTTGAGAAKDRAAIMSPGNDFMKVFTTFFTPGSVLYSRMHDIGYDVKSGNIPKAMAKTFWTVIMASVTQKLITGHTPDKDHDETWTGWLAKNEALYPLSSVPMLRELSETLVTGKEPPSTNPIVRSAEQLLKLRSTIAKAVGGDISHAQAAEDTARAANMFVGLPIDQLFITGDYLRDLSTGDVSKPDDLFNWWHNVLHYHRKGK